MLLLYKQLLFFVPMFAPLGAFCSFLLAVGIVVVLCERFAFFRTLCGFATIFAVYAGALFVIFTVFEDSLFSLFDVVFDWRCLNGGYEFWSRIAGCVAVAAIVSMICLWFVRRRKESD